MKQCYKCKESKQLNEFCKSSRFKDGLSKKCKQCDNETSKKYYEKNKPKRIEYMIRYNTDKFKTNPAYKKQCNIRDNINYHLTEYLNGKPDRYIKHLECTASEYKTYIENKFDESMSWNDRKTFHIDHIIPLSKNGSFHYTNTQPLKPIDNIRKKNTLVGEIINPDTMRKNTTEKILRNSTYGAPLTDNTSPDTAYKTIKSQTTINK